LIKEGIYMNNLQQKTFKSDSKDIQDVSREAINTVELWLKHSNLAEDEFIRKINGDGFYVVYFRDTTDSRCCLYNNNEMIGTPFVSDGDIEKFEIDLCIVLYRIAVMSGRQKTYDYILKFIKTTFSFQ
jgi:hypothetical protein